MPALLLAVCVLLASAVPAAAVAPAVAPAGAIEVLDASEQNNFPRDVVFALSARGDTDIVAATLRYKQAGKATVTANQIRFEPAREVDLEYVWDLQRYYAPPGVDIEYFWLLEDAEGNSLRSPTATFPLEDVRFTWRTIVDGPIELNWYAGDDTFASDLMQASRRALDQLAASAGVESDLPIKVFVYGNQRDLLSGLRASAHEWTGGTAFSDEGVVLAAVEPTTSGLQYGRRVLPHEISHVIVHAITKNPYGDIPRWLDEGLAMYAEGELEAGYEQALANAIRRNSLISVQSLSANFPSDPQAAHLSYAQSYSLVSFIIDEYGRDGIAQMLETFKEGSTYDGALEAALGVDTDGLDAAWREAIGAPPSPPVPQDAQAQPRSQAPTGTDLRFVLVAAALGVAVFVLLTRGRGRRR